MQHIVLSLFFKNINTTFKCFFLKADLMGEKNKDERFKKNESDVKKKFFK